MKKFLLTTIFAFIGAWVFAQERIAVFPFEDMDIVLTRNQANMFYDEFINEVKKRMPNSIIVPRNDVERLINMEAVFQLSDFSAREKTAEMQRVLNGTQILSGRIGKLGNELRITAYLCSYPDLIWLPGGATVSAANTSELFNKIPELVQKMQAGMSDGRSGASGRTYKIGDTGPAGGIVFYDRGFVADGWRYLEAAPANTEFIAEWGAFDRDIVGTDKSVGSGKHNTQIIVEYLKIIGERNRAAQICAAMEINSYIDWFLPSEGELDLMYKNLHQKKLGNFNNDKYWSSTQSGLATAQYQSFSNSIDNNKGRNIGKNKTEQDMIDAARRYFVLTTFFKKEAYSVRAIRAF